MPEPWWRAVPYVGEEVLPRQVLDLSGPNGVALVRAWPDGRTDAGWGLDSPSTGKGFMPRYVEGEFNARRVLFGYDRDRWAFAIVMRSVQMVCIDIDGKNGGFDHAKKLGMLPPTLTETSKSGNGYHLFYTFEEDWDPVTGFGTLSDRIGIEQGVDIRATGCVYHHKQQRWNGREAVPLPEHLHEMLLHREQKLAATTARIDTVLANQDSMEVLMMQAEILAELKKPVPQGKRNVTLFAIGNQMRQAQIPDWEKLLTERADELGLDRLETTKLVANIARYGSPATP